MGGEGTSESETGESGAFPELEFEAEFEFEFGFEWTELDEEDGWNGTCVHRRVTVSRMYRAL